MQDIDNTSRLLRITVKAAAILCGFILIGSSVLASGDSWSVASAIQSFQDQPTGFLIGLNWFIGSFLVLVGIFFIPLPKKRGNPTFIGEKDLQADAYKLYLVEKYEIKRNIVLNRLSCQSRLFQNAEDALKFVHQLECPSFVEPVFASVDVTTSQPSLDSVAQVTEQVAAVEMSDPIPPMIAPTRGVELKAEPESSPHPIETKSSPYRLVLLLGVALLMLAAGGLYYADRQGMFKVKLVSVPVEVVNTNSDQVVAAPIAPIPNPQIESTVDATIKSAAVPINELWLGVWSSDDSKQKLTITPSILKYGVVEFSWVGLRPKGAIQCCPAFYEGSTTKADLIARIQSSTGGSSKPDPQKIVDLVNGLGEGNFKKIVLADPVLRKYFFIYDQNHVYRISRDVGDNANLVIEQFKKQE